MTIQMPVEVRAVASTAVLVLDIFNGCDFPGGDALFVETRSVLPNIVALCERARQFGVPVIFGNDHFDRWQDDFDRVLDHVAATGDAGSLLVQTLRPHPGDFRLLKPRHSAFFETPLPSLLAHLHVRRVVVCGIATDSCVLATVLDAHVRGLTSIVPVGTTASQSQERTDRTLTHLRESCHVSTPSFEQVFDNLHSNGDLHARHLPASE